MKLLIELLFLIAGCDLDEEGKEDANEEAEGSGRKKKTRLN